MGSVHGDPAALGVDPDRLQELVDQAWNTRTDALCVWVRGELVVEWPPEAVQKPIETMSVTKSIVGLAVMALRDEEKLRLDQPASTWAPRWRRDRRRAITLEHLLDQASGLAAPMPATVYRQTDFVAFARGLLAIDKPGGFSYNNAATNLMAAVVLEASGQSLDQYVATTLFAPLGIEEYGWTMDKAGNPQAMSGLQLRAADLAKLGRLLLQRGQWDGTQVLSGALVDDLFSPGSADPGYHHLWWMIMDKGSPDPTVRGVRADGYLGQALVVLPDVEVVAVRQMFAYPGVEDNDTFLDFFELVEGLVLEVEAEETPVETEEAPPPPPEVSPTDGG
jgi:CubicO group peptidase (beta-lactamase class C family)